jgi:nitrogen-specific signal transduction histidine kinase
MQDKFDRRIHIEFRRGDSIPPVMADSFQLYSAILNLCINAAEAIESLLNNPQLSNRHSDSFFIQLSLQTLSSASLPESVKGQISGKSEQYAVISDPG